MRFALFVLPLLALEWSLPAFGTAASQQVQTQAAELTQQKTTREASLRKGMSADQVLKIMGKPDEITPMQAPSGKAEVWNYRTRIEGNVERIEVGSRPITGLERGRDGTERQVILGHEPIYGLQRHATIRTYQILMFNDEMLNEKLTKQEVRTMQ